MTNLNQVLLAFSLGLSGCQVVSGLNDLEANGKLASAQTGDAGALDAGSRRTEDSPEEAGAGRDRTVRGSGGSAAVGGSRDTGGSAAVGGRVATDDPDADGGTSDHAGEGGSRATRTCVPPILSGAACDPVAQCGCGKKENCRYRDFTTLGCYPAGQVAPYNVCDADHSCGVGYTCFYGSCHRFCDNEQENGCEGVGAKCTKFVSGSTPYAGGYICTNLCNPVHPELTADGFRGCGPNLNCFVWGYEDAHELGTTDCARSQGNLEGASCEADTQCAPGLWCSQSRRVCSRVCAIGGNDCAPDEVCTSLTPHIVIADNREFGVCEPPCKPLPEAASGSVCNVVTQCGCADDQSCQVLNSDGLTACVAAGKVEPNQTCSSPFDCSKGFTCRDGVCKRFCDGTKDSDCSCSQATMGSTLVPGFFVCDLCNPADPATANGVFAACAQGRACLFRRNAFNCIAASGNGMQGAVCETDNQHDDTKCASGFLCDSDSICKKWCQLGGPSNQCGSGTCEGPSARLAEIAVALCK